MMTGQHKLPTKELGFLASWVEATTSWDRPAGILLLTGQL